MFSTAAAACRVGTVVGCMLLLLRVVCVVDFLSRHERVATAATAATATATAAAAAAAAAAAQQSRLTAPPPFSLHSSKTISAPSNL